MRRYYVPANTWTGFYVGANGGYGWSADKATTSSFANDDGATATSPTASFDRNGGFGGAQIGYNVQRGQLVFGIEADIQGAGIRGSATTSASADNGDVIATGKATSSLDWFGTVRGRLGYAYDRSLFYFTGGLAFGGVKDRLALTFDDRQDNGGISTSPFREGHNCDRFCSRRWRRIRSDACVVAQG